MIAMLIVCVCSVCVYTIRVIVFRLLSLVLYYIYGDLPCSAVLYMPLAARAARSFCGSIVVPHSSLPA